MQHPPTEFTGILESISTKVEERWMHALVSTDLSKRQPFIIIHGLITSSRCMRPLAEKLASHFRVYAPDLPGFGKTFKPDHTFNIREHSDFLNSWMLANNITDPIILGNSMGSQIAIDLATRHRAAQRLILTAPTPDIFQRTRRKHILNWFKGIPSEKSSIVLPFFQDLYDSGVKRPIKTIRPLLEDEIEHKLPLIRIPTLIVRGERDRIVSQKWSEQVHRMIEGSQFITLKGAPHNLPYSAVDQLLPVILQFCGIQENESIRTVPDRRIQ